MKKLNLVFLLIASILFSCSGQEKVKIFLAGDSTLAEKLETKRPETGWGEKLGEYFNNNVEIENHARNGRSTRTFISEGRWQAIIDSLKPGNYVFIQFGHNDESKQKVDRYTPPEDFKNNLRKFIDEVRAKDGIPVLITPVVRRRFNSDNEFYDVHGEYPDLVREVAAEKNDALLELHRKSEKLLIELGKDKSQELFLWVKPGESPNYPEGKEDNTHFNDHGAKVIAGLVAECVRESNLKLKDYLKK